MTDLHKSLKALNDAAYAAIRAGHNTKLYPHLDRQTLEEIAKATDALVDANAPVIERGKSAALRARQMNAELPDDQRDVLLAKGMV